MSAFKVSAHPEAMRPITDRELALTTTLKRTTEALTMATKERDQLKAALEATSLREAELTAELGDLPEAQADMLATIKRLKADVEHYRKAAQMAVEMIETNAHERRHVRWALIEAMKGTA